MLLSMIKINKPRINLEDIDRKIDIGFKSVSEDIKEVLGYLKWGFERADKKIDVLDQKIGGLENRFDNLESHLAKGFADVTKEINRLDFVLSTKDQDAD